MGERTWPGAAEKTLGGQSYPPELCQRGLRDKEEVLFKPSDEQSHKLEVRNGGRGILEPPAIPTGRKMPLRS